MKPINKQQPVSFWHFPILSLLIIIFSSACGIKAGSILTLTVPPTSLSTDAPRLPHVTATQLNNPSNVAETQQAKGNFTEEFIDEITGWSNFLQGNNNTIRYARYYQEGGKLIFDIDAVDTGLYLIYEDHSYVNVEMKVSAENILTRSSISLICGYSETRGWYEFNISTQGTYTLRKFDAQGKSTIIRQGGSRSIRVGQDVNDYTLNCIASKSISFSVNNTKVIEEADFYVPVGRAGIAVWVTDLHPIRVEIDKITIKNP